MSRYKEITQELKPATPLIFLYDGTGGQSFGATGAFHTWDTTAIKTEDFIYTSDTNRIYCGNSINGLYKITFNCSFLIMDEGYDTLVSSIYKNGTQLSGSLVADFLSQSQVGAGSQTITYVMYLKKGDYIQINTYSVMGNTGLSLTDTSRLSIEFIPMQGWNNSAGGQTNYRGGVMR